MLLHMTSQGRITLPAEIRARLGLKPGDQVSIEDDGDRILITPLLRDPVAALQGALKGYGAGTDELLADRRWEEQHELERGE